MSYIRPLVMRKITKRGGQRKEYLGRPRCAKILLQQNSSNVFCEMISQNL